MRVRSCQDASGWCPLCYAGVKGRATYRGHYGYRAPARRYWEYWEMALTRRRDKGVSLNDTPLSQDCAFGKKWPDLVNFLGQCWWGPDEAREPGTLLLLYEDGRVKVWVNDKDAQLSCFCSGATVAEALSAAQKAIVDGTGDWRTPRKDAGRRK